MEIAFIQALRTIKAGDKLFKWEDLLSGELSSQSSPGVPGSFKQLKSA